MPWIRICLFFLTVMVSLGIARYQYLIQTPPQTHGSEGAIAATRMQPTKSDHSSFAIHRPAGRLAPSLLTPFNAMEMLRNQYRLPPDRRFILALLQLHKLTHPEEEALLEIAYVANSWQISLNSVVIAHLDVLPDFTSS